MAKGLTLGSWFWTYAVRLRGVDTKQAELEHNSDDVRLRAKVQRQGASVREGREAIAELQARLSAATDRLDQRRRSSLTPKVLAQLLPLRAAERVVLAEDRAAAAARDAQFAQTSSSYEATTNDAGREALLRRLEINGLTWWVPINAAAEERTERPATQGFPLRAILQTRELSLGGVMLDLGANIGRTSIPRVLLGDIRAVYAAEPEPFNYACLVQNVVEHGLQGFVMPDRVAIGAARGDATLRQSQYLGGHRLLHSQPRHAVRSVTVPVWSVDAWMAHHRIDPDTVTFVKVDTQGSEVGVLTGAASLLARRRAAWQIEIDPSLLRGAGVDVCDVVQLLQQHFTHFIDLGSAGRGPRVQPVAAMSGALGYLGSGASKTDVLVYCASR
jgi:FkbM family methyltransferase